MECTPNKFTISELAEAWKNGSLKINEEYQRGASWSTWQKQALVDSLFREYPIPPLFLHEIREPGLGGKEATRYEIVDGQQRIRALAEYRADKFPLLDPGDKRLRLPNSLRGRPAPWAKRRFSELDQAAQSSLVERKLDAFVIARADSDEIRDLFIRLQSGTALTRQQVRDAWPGNVGPYMERLAGKLDKHPSVQLFRLVDRRGTSSEDEKDEYESDRQFCAQLLCLFLAREHNPVGPHSVGPNDLDQLYHDYTGFERERDSAKRFEDVLKKTTEVFEAAVKKAENKDRKKRKFRKLDVIATFMLIADRTRSPLFKLDRSSIQKLATYVHGENSPRVTGKITSGKTLLEYYEKWREKITDRIGIQLDPRRVFDEKQRAQIYSRDGGKCQVCQESVESSDAEYDHYPVPWAVGGKTEIGNGRLVHAKCHARGPVSEEDA